MQRRRLTASGLEGSALAPGSVHSRPFVGATIVGATSIAQPEADLAAATIPLGAEVLAAIAAVNARYASPAAGL